MSVWFTSDLHFGHVNILKYTPQRREYLGLSDDADVNDMNEAIVELWNTQVAPDDHVYVIGDVAMGKVQDTIEFVRQLNGKKFLTMGNHDRPHRIMHKTDEQTAEWTRVYNDVGFTIMPDTWETEFGGVLAKVCHFPYYGDHSEDRYNADKLAPYTPIETGMPLVHGHVHDLWKTRGGIMYNVGIDAWDGVFQTPEAIGDYFRANGFQ